ncbi:Ribonuclease H-like protein [Macrophomina phaseolina MS6]|uniref:Ribonuclease H-like protein n=1 Tax=Macrophomina phaseolina (strain MS6) TaxID=1126212 RepID=K2SD51_MACPH|nr:Ribonuclease H-like protein [Macrophomina phaseolina MS6]
MPLPRAIGPILWHSSHHTLNHSVQLLRVSRSSSLHVCRPSVDITSPRTFRSTPRAHFDDDDSPENWMRQLQGSAPHREDELRKRLLVEKMAAARKEERERERRAHERARKKVEEWYRQKKDLEERIDAAERSVALARRRIISIREETRTARLALLTKQLQPLTDRIAGLDEGLALVKTDVDTVKSNRAARLDKWHRSVTQLTAKLCAEYDGLLKEGRKSAYHLEDLVKEIESYQKEEQLAAAERAVVRREFNTWKEFVRSYKKEAFSTNTYLSGVLGALQDTHDRLHECLEGLRLSSAEIQADLHHNWPPSIREHLAAIDDTNGHLITYLSEFFVQPRRRLCKWWDKQNVRFAAEAHDLALEFHLLDRILRYSRYGYADDAETSRLLQLEDKFHEFVDLSHEVRVFMMDCIDNLNEKIRSATFGTQKAVAVKLRSRWRHWLTTQIVMSHLNSYIRPDITSLNVRHQLKHLIEKADLRQLRRERIMWVIERASKQITTAIGRFADYERDVRNSGYDFPPANCGPIRRRFIKALKPVTVGWTEIRANGIDDLKATVNRESAHLAVGGKLDAIRKHLVSYAKNKLLEEYEHTSFFELSDPASLSPRVLQYFMKTWPEKYFEAGLAVASERSRELSVLRNEAPSQKSISNKQLQEYVLLQRGYQSVVSWAVKFAPEWRTDQKKWLAEACIELTPRYRLDDALLRRLREQGSKLHFSPALYRVDPEVGWSGMPEQPAQYYHMTPTNNADVVRQFKGKYIGFDMAWNCNAEPDQGFKANASLLVFARDTAIDCFHLARYPETKGRSIVPEEVAMALESPELIKVGLGVQEKCDRLRHFLGLSPRGFVDLENLHYDLKEIQLGEPVPRIPLSLQNLASEHLGLPLGPRAMRNPPDLLKPLSRAHKLSMGEKAYACFALWHAMQAKQRDLLQSRQKDPVSAFSRRSVLLEPKCSKRTPQAVPKGEDTEDFYPSLAGAPKSPVSTSAPTMNSTSQPVAHERQMLFSSFGSAGDKVSGDLPERLDASLAVAEGSPAPTARLNRQPAATVNSIASAQHHLPKTKMGDPVMSDAEAWAERLLARRKRGIPKPLVVTKLNREAMSYRLWYHHRMRVDDLLEYDQFSGVAGLEEARKEVARGILFAIAENKLPCDERIADLLRLFPEWKSIRSLKRLARVVGFKQGDATVSNKYKAR